MVTGHLNMSIQSAAKRMAWTGRRISPLSTGPRDNKVNWPPGAGLVIIRPSNTGFMPARALNGLAN